jgi:outer membrane protein OmpA-like peptidoglycan-associated protein
MNDLEAQMRPAAAGAPAMPPREQNFLVFFEFDRAQLTPEAAQVVQRALSTYRAGGAPRIVVTGHADRAGSPGYNESLSEKRAAEVRAALVKAGVPANQIVVRARGENAPLVPTPDGVAEPQNRRVEIGL